MYHPVPAVPEGTVIALCRKNKSANWHLFEAAFDSQVMRAAHAMVRNVVAAEEVAQEARYKIFKGFETFDGDEGKIRAWINSIVRNVVADYFDGDETTDPEDSLATVAADNSCGKPEHAVMAQCEIEAKAAKINSLKEIDRLIVMGVLAGLDRKVIAAQIGRSRNYVDLRIHRIPGKLRRGKS